MKTNSIGLNKNKTEKLVNQLNELLADFQMHYQNIRGLHWNIKGKNFFELHLKFEELYNDAQIKVDLVAERILTLEGQPLHTFEDYIKISKNKVAKNIFKDVKAIQVVVDSFTIILQLERQILESSAKTEDEGTNSMISDFITEQEKTLWMLRSWLA